MKYQFLFYSVIIIYLMLSLGCSQSSEPESTIPDKLNSPDPAEREKGLQEAEQKWG